jgi:hypothetical protein
MRRAAARRTDLAGLLERAQAKRWAGREWTPEQIALLGTIPDEELAALTGRRESAVRVKRSKLRIPTYRDRRPDKRPLVAYPLVEGRASENLPVG